MRSTPAPLIPAGALLLALAAACGGEPVKLAQEAQKLEIAAPKSQVARRYVVDPASTRLGFDMEAPIEKIRGRVPAEATTGELFIDPSDLRKTTGLIHVDLAGLELYQRQAPAAGQEFGEEKKDATQNVHARQWLEIGPDTPEDQLKKNAIVEFSLQEVLEASATDVTKLTGAERKVTFTAAGEFLLHQRKARKTVKLEATFAWSGDAATGVTVRSLEPLEIGLDEYDVRPRSAFGKLAAKTLESLSEKVAKYAEVTLEFTARPAPDDKPTMQSAGAGAAPATPSAPAAAPPPAEPDTKTPAKAAAAPKEPPATR
jgi:hypothetical protein